MFRCSGYCCRSQWCEELHDHEIEEGNPFVAMYSLALLLESGSEGVAADPSRVVELFERAVGEGNFIIALCSLAFLLESGCDGVASDPIRAVELYERTIEEGNDFGAINDLE